MHLTEGGESEDLQRNKLLGKKLSAVVKQVFGAGRACKAGQGQGRHVVVLRRGQLSSQVRGYYR